MDPSAKEETFSMDRLDDETLGLIIGYLPLPDKVRVERVNKRWQTIALKSFRKEKLIEVYWDFEKKKMGIPQIKEILWRCGENLTHLNLAELDDIKPRCIFTLINKYCKNLEHLSVSTLRFEENDLNMLSGNVIKNLKSVNMDDCDLKDSAMLSSFFRKAVKLEKLSAACNFYLWGESLLHLKPTVKSLNLSSGSKFYDNELMYYVFANLPNLEVLDISDTHIWAAGLEEVCHRLKSLNMSCMKQFFEDDESFTQLSFEKLEILDASEQCVSNGFLPFIAKECPELKRLNLSGVFTPDSEPELFKPLKSLQKLVRLIISESEVNDDVIEYWMNENMKFKQLECADCSGITQTGIIRIIESLPELEFIYFGHKPRLNVNKVLETALKSVELRTDKTSLKIQFYSKKKADDEVEELKSKSKTGNEPLSSLVDSEVKIEYTFLNEIKRTNKNNKEEVLYSQTVKFTPCKA